MTDDDYGNIANALQAISDSKNWRKSIESIQSYVDDPARPVAKTVSAPSVLLIAYGRQHPEALGRLLDLVKRVKSKDIDIDLYIQENKEALDKAFEFLNSLERPQRTVNALLDTDGDPEKVRKLDMRGDKKLLRPLIPIVRISPTRFSALVEKRLLGRRMESDSRKLERSRVYYKRAQMQKELYCYLKRTDTLSPDMKAQFKELCRRATLAADVYTSQSEEKGKTKAELRAEFWEIYDRDLASTLRILDNEKRGAVVRREFIHFPEIVDKTLKMKNGPLNPDKLNRLKQKFK